MTIDPNLLSPYFELGHLTSPLRRPSPQEEMILYNSDSRVSSALSYLIELFQKENLHLACDLNRGKILAYDAISPDLKKMSEKVVDYLQKSDSRPLFQIENQTFFCDLDFSSPVIGLETPHANQWTKILKSPPHPLFLSTESFLLPSGKTYSLHAFVEHPLFKYTLEKYNVFAFLTFFVQDPSFQQQYGDFLNHIRLENWFDPYLSNPKGLANLSLIAFLEGQISQEDLFVIHMVASAIQESSEEDPVQISTLQKENAQDFLTLAGYPPFDTTSFRMTKSVEEREKAQKEILLRLETKSSIQRTTIAYPIRPGSIERGLLLNTKHYLGYVRHSHTIAVLPPLLCLELYEITSVLKEPPPSKHTLMFGFNNDKSSLATLTEGRPISIASPLFVIPYVHNYSKGQQLGITVHDVLFHIALDWQNPHCRIFIQLGEALLANADSKKSDKKFIIYLLDRECPAYLAKYTHPLIPFWRALASFAAKQPTRLSSATISCLQATIPLAFFHLKIISALIQVYKEELESTCFDSKTTVLSLKISFLEKIITKEW